jgi:hypothetical protein
MSLNDTFKTLSLEMHGFSSNECVIGVSVWRCSKYPSITCIEGASAGKCTKYSSIGCVKGSLRGELYENFEYRVRERGLRRGNVRKFRVSGALSPCWAHAAKRRPNRSPFSVSLPCHRRWDGTAAIVDLAAFLLFGRAKNAADSHDECRYACGNGDKRPIP